MGALELTYNVAKLIWLHHGCGEAYDMNASLEWGTVLRLGPDFTPRVLLRWHYGQVTLKFFGYENCFSWKFHAHSLRFSYFNLVFRLRRAGHMPPHQYCTRRPSLP